ncbi:MAG: hypothetical protein U9R05_07100, partial [Chloroflexota bacterium]|nr:hypothetical protein [Chloroflexota bacterium]
DEPATKGDLDQVKQDLTDKIDVNGKKIERVEQRLTAKIDANGAKIDANSAKIDANGKKIDANSAKIDANSAKIDANGAKIDANGAKIDRLIRRVVENSERLDKMLTEEKFKVYFNEIMNSIDGLAKVVSRGEQERAATNARIDRVERDLSAVVDRQA